MLGMFVIVFGLVALVLIALIRSILFRIAPRKGLEVSLITLPLVHVGYLMLGWGFYAMRVPYPDLGWSFLFLLVMVVFTVFRLKAIRHQIQVREELQAEIAESLMY